LPADESERAASGPRRATSGFIALFLAYDVAVSFAYPRIDTRLRTYPFSAFPMFSRIRAKKPYSEHQTYEILGGRLLVEAEPAITEDVQTDLDLRHAWRFLHEQTDPAVLERRLGGVAEEVRRRYDRTIHRVTLELVVYQVPAYPAHAEITPHPVGVIAELDADAGVLHTLLGQVRRDGDRLIVQPRTAAGGEPIEIAVHADDSPQGTPVSGTWQDGALVVPASQAASYLVTGRSSSGDGRWFVIGRDPPIR
jgi:hypothetical protein